MFCTGPSGDSMIVPGKVELSIVPGKVELSIVPGKVELSKAGISTMTTKIIFFLCLFQLSQNQLL